MGGLHNEGKWIETIYVKDAQGNTITPYSRTYQPDNSNSIEKLVQEDVILYGSARIGVYNRERQKQVKCVFKQV